MEPTFATKAARVIIAEESGPARQLLSETLRRLGFLEITVMTTAQDVFEALEHLDCEWIVMPSYLRHSISAFHILKIIAETPALRHVRVSLLLEKSEESLLPAAFDHGLLSWHPRSQDPGVLTNEMSKLTDLMKLQNWTMRLVTHEYFRNYMNSVERHDEVLDVERNLLALFPGSLPLLLKYGENQLRLGNIKEGLGTFQQACIIDERSKKIVDTICEKYTTQKVILGSSQFLSQNVLGIRVCVLIDPDTSVLSTLRKLLSQLGVEHIETFDDGEKAWQWLRSHPEPDLILQEWKIPNLSGPLLLQRIRHHGFINVPINVISSVIKPEESHLLREFAVANVIAKPFASQGLFKSLIWTLQQHVYPTEQNSIQQKIKRLLQSGQIREASQLRDAFVADSRVTMSSKKTVEANFAFEAGDFRYARELATDALKLQGDSLCLLSLIGKCLVKLGDSFSAVKIFEKIQSMSQLNIETLCCLALAQFESGGFDEAVLTLRKAAALDIGSQMIYETDCQMAILGGDKAKARTLIKEITTLHNLIEYLSTRALRLAKTGFFDEGLKILQRLNEALPPEYLDAKDEVAYNQSLVLARYGEPRQALEALQTVFNRPDSKIIRLAQELGKLIATAMGQSAQVSYYAARPKAAHALGLKAEETFGGELCLNGLYRMAAQDEKIWTALIQNAPNFMDKSDEQIFLLQRGL